GVAVGRGSGQRDLPPAAKSVPGTRLAKRRHGFVSAGHGPVPGIKGLALVCSVALAAGCGSGGDSMVVREHFEAVQVPHRVAGTTTRAPQVVRHDCKISVVYDVREAAGSAFLIQSQVLHPRLRGPESAAALPG